MNRNCLFFDGASKKNRGRAGAGGILLKPRGDNPITYGWGLGETSNNKAEAYGLLIGTKILKEKEIKDPIIMGDSTIIIEAMINT